MWSDQYHYFNIYYDEELSLTVQTSELKKFLLSLEELKQKSNFTFNNQIGFPFTEIILLNAKSLNSWSQNDTNKNKTNLLSIVCEKGKAESFEKLNTIFTKITEFLNWQLVEED